MNKFVRCVMQDAYGSLEVGKVYQVSGESLFHYRLSGKGGGWVKAIFEECEREEIVVQAVSKKDPNAICKCGIFSSSCTYHKNQ